MKRSNGHNQDLECQFPGPCCKWVPRHSSPKLRLSTWKEYVFAQPISQPYLLRTCTRSTRNSTPLLLSPGGNCQIKKTILLGVYWWIPLSNYQCTCTQKHNSV